MGCRRHRCRDRSAGRRCHRGVRPRGRDRRCCRFTRQCQHGAHRGGCHPAPDESIAQPLAAFGQPVIEGRRGAVQPARGVLVGQPFQVAEDDRQAMTVGQPVDLVVEDRAHIEIEPGPGPIGYVHCRGLRLVSSPPFPIDVPLHRRAIGRAVQPAAQGVARVDRGRFAGQDEERGLEGVFHIVVIAQDRAAGRCDHRPVPRHQGLEGRSVVRGGVSAEEFAVAKPDRRAAAEEVAEGLQARPQCSACHDRSAPCRPLIRLPNSVREPGRSPRTAFPGESRISRTGAMVRSYRFPDRIGPLSDAVQRPFFIDDPPHENSHTYPRRSAAPPDPRRERLRYRRAQGHRLGRVPGRAGDRWRHRRRGVAGRAPIGST